jgi:putative oxidoreductase
MGFRPVPLFAAASIAAELGGGLALAVGFLTPLPATLLIGQSAVIIGKAHWPRGFWNRDNGFEFPLSLAAGVVAILLIGPGAVSVDEAAGLAFSDTVRLWLLLVGLLGGAVSILVATMASRAAADGPAASAADQPKHRTRVRRTISRGRLLRLAPPMRRGAPANASAASGASKMVGPREATIAQNRGPCPNTRRWASSWTTTVSRASGGARTSRQLNIRRPCRDALPQRLRGSRRLTAAGRTPSGPAWSPIVASSATRACSRNQASRTRATRS